MPKSKPEKPVEPTRDLADVFDLNRHKAVRDFVERFESLFKDRLAINEDIKELSGEIRAANFTPKEVRAMKTVAKLRVDDKILDARETLAAMNRVAAAVKIDLFAWADAKEK